MTDADRFEAFFEEVLNVTDPLLLTKIADVSEFRYFKKGEILIRIGEVPQYMFFLWSGVVRSFVQLENDEESTLAFAHTKGYVMMPDGDLHRPATNTLEALTPVRAIVIPMTEVDRLFAEYPTLYVPLTTYLAKSATFHLERQAVLAKSSAVEHYRWFLENYSDLVGVIPDKYIASFLGLTTITISRVRHALRDAEAPQGDNSVPPPTKE